MNFDAAYAKWMEDRQQTRKGESLRRLREGHGYLEKLFLSEIWWPAVGNFEHLHPEFEIIDDRGAIRFLDFAYLRAPHKIALEMDGFNAHAREMDRRQFSEERKKQNFLLLNGWKMLRFSSDDIKASPAYCRQTVIQMFGEWYAGQPAKMTPVERDIMWFAIKLERTFRLPEVCSALNIGEKYARRSLARLAELNLPEPASGTKRITSYRLGSSAGKFY